MSPDIFARKVLNLVAKNKPIIIVPPSWKLHWWTNRLSPSVEIFLAQKFFQNTLRKLGVLQKD
jgi:short-subunit dehydrogenase